MLNKKALFALSIVAVAGLSGCASVPMATPEEDAKAKEFVAVSGKSNIYIYRNESLGAAVKMPVLIDGVSVGDTVADSYILRTMDPGKHTILSKGENDSTLELDAKANTNYYVWQEIKMGVFSARSNLHNVDDATGKAAVSECKLIK